LINRSTKNARILILLGLFLVVMGVVLPFLMVIKILESTFFLNFFSYAAQVSGVILGILGLAMQQVDRED
jgi:hypothetical protein